VSFGFNTPAASPASALPGILCVDAKNSREGKSPSAALKNQIGFSRQIFLMQPER